MGKLGFVSPEALFLLIFLPAVWYFMKVWEAKRRERLKLLGVRPKKDSGKRILWPVLILGLLILPMSRPYLGFEDMKVDTRGHDIFAVVDISRSMLTDDVSPSRLDFTKRKLKDLLALAALDSVDNRIGLVLFAGDSYLFCPPTSDLAVVAQFVDTISTDLISAQGTELAAALDRALQSAAEVGAIEPMFLVLSDGEEINIDAEKIANKFKALDFRINTLGFGTTEGRPIPVGDGTFVQDSAGEIVVSRLNESALSLLAKRTNGLYYRARVDDSDLRSILAGFDADHRGLQKEKTIRVYNEFGPMLLWLPALLILIVILPRGSYALPAALLVLSAPIARAEPLVPSNRSAYEAYNAGNYDSAEKLFRDALKENPDDSRSIMGLGSSLFRLKRYEESADAYKSYVEKAQSEREVFEGLYNMGNAHLFGGNPAKAIPDYERALTIKPDDAKTAANLDIAREMLKKKQEQQQQQQQQQQQKQQQNQKPEDKDKQDKNKKDDKSQDNEPSSGGDKQENQDASPNGDASPGPSPASSPSKGSGADSRSDKQDGDDAQSELSSELDKLKKQRAAPTPGRPEKKLNSDEAEAWLDSLPDAPLLVPQKRGYNPRSREQTW